MEFETLLFEREGGLAHIRLNRPDSANALNDTMGRELKTVTAELDCDPSVRAVLITSTGKLFCAGGDLNGFAAHGDKLGVRIKELTLDFHGAMSRLMRMAPPVIVAVQGVAAGAGLSIACAGDLVLASERAKFTMAYTKAGLVPDGGSTHVIPRLVGLRRAQELMLTNRVLSAEEALDWGLVTRVVAHDALEAEARALAEQIAAGPTVAFGFVKRLLMSTTRESYETQMELESQGISTAATTADGREGIAAFREKRPARFTGR